MEIIVPKIEGRDFINTNGLLRLKELSTLTLDDLFVHQSDTSIPDFIFLGPIFIATLNMFGGNGFQRKLIVIDHSGLLPNHKGILNVVVLRTNSTYNDYNWLEAFNMYNVNDTEATIKETLPKFDNSALKRLIDQLLREFDVTEEHNGTNSPCATLFYGENAKVTYDKFYSNIAYIPNISIGYLENKGISRDFSSGHLTEGNYYKNRYMIHDYHGAAGFLRLVSQYLPNETEVLYKSDLYRNYRYDALINLIDLNFFDQLIKDYPGKEIYTAERSKWVVAARKNLISERPDLIQEEFIRTIIDIWPVLNSGISDSMGSSLLALNPLYRVKKNGLKDYFVKLFKMCEVDTSYLLNDGTNILPYHEFETGMHFYTISPDTVNRCLPYLECLNNYGLNSLNMFPEAVKLLNDHFNSHIDECFYILQIALIENQIDNYLSWDFISLNDESILLYDSLFKFNKFLQTYFKTDIDDRKRAFMFIFGLKTIRIGKNTKFSELFSLGTYHPDIDKLSFNINELISNVSNQYMLFIYILLKRVLTTNYLEV